LPTTQSESESPSSGGTTGWAAFRYPDFTLLFIVRILNGMGSVMLQLAISWEIWRITHDEWTLGMIGLVQFAPNLVFFLAAGTTADRFVRQYVMAVSYLLLTASAILLYLVFSAEAPQIWYAFCILILVGIGRTFSQPAQQSLVPNVVPPEHFPNAVAWGSSAQQLSTVIGPVLGGALLLLGATTVFLTVAAGYALSVVLMMMVRTRVQAKPKGPVTLDSLFAGMRYIFHRQIILGGITLDLFAVIFGTVNALLPVFATDVLNVGELGLGFLRGAHAVGAMSCGLILTHIPVSRHAGRMLLLSVASYGLSIGVFGLSETWWLSLLALACAGASDMVSVFIRATLVQLATPDEMRGRVAAVHGMCTNASGQLGDTRAGFVAAVIGAPASVVVAACVTVALAVGYAVWFPRLRKVDSLTLAELQDKHGF
jgi:MFS family permease